MIVSLPFQAIVAGALAAGGIAALAAAVTNERRMHGHRQKGVSYSAATLRRDGGWCRGDLFTSEGLAHQRRASAWGMAGALLLVASVLAWIVLGII